MIMRHDGAAVEGIPVSRRVLSLQDMIGMPVAWGALGVLALIDAVWCRAVGLSVLGVWPSLLVAAVLLAIGLGYRVSGRSERIAAAGEVATLWVMLSVVGGVMSYAAARTQDPLWDGWFVAADRALGLDWLGWRDAITALPGANIVLVLAYSSFIPQLCLSMIIFAFSGRADRNADLFWLCLISVAIVCGVSAFTPAVGALPHYGFSQSAPYLSDLLALRRPGAFDMDGRLQGIVTFPSYHTCVAVAIMYAWRGFGWKTVGIVVLNGIMLLSTPTIGGHYFIDMISGFAVVLGAIAMIRLARRIRLAGVIG